MAGEEQSELWECGAGQKIPAAESLAETHQGPVEEFRQKTRPLFEWEKVEPCSESSIDPALASELEAMGIRPRYRYETPSIFSLAGAGSSSIFSATNSYEYWLSDDGITSATVSLEGDEPKIGGFETRFAGPTVLVHTQYDRGLDEPWLEGASFGEDFVAGYRAHRARVEERVRDGEVALSIAEDTDREAFWQYYANYMSGRELADNLEGFENLPDSSGKGWWLWGGGIVATLVGLAASWALGWEFVRQCWDWLVVWWPIAVVAAAPGALGSYAVLLFRGHLNHLDTEYPDVLDEHAGYWLQRQVAAQGLADEVEVGKASESFLSGLDAYLPLRNKIVLGERTYEKQDPAFWAIAAHELGHAVAYNRQPAVRPLSLTSRRGMRRLMSWIHAGLLANVFFGWSAMNDVLWWMIVAILACGAVVLIDEALASIIGLRILREDGQLPDAVIADQRRHLALAFFTYCSGLIVLAGMLFAWEWITDYIMANATFEPAEPLYPGRTTLANFLSLIVVAGVVYLERERAERWFRRLFGRSKPADTDTDTDTGDDQPDASPDGKSAVWGCLAILAGLAASAGFFLEVWDQPLGPWFRAAVFAYTPLVIFLLAPVLTPIHLLLHLPRFIIEKLGVVPDEPEQESTERVGAAADDVPSKIKVIDPRQSTPWYLDVASPGLSFHALPLVVLWWASQF